MNEIGLAIGHAIAAVSPDALGTIASPMGTGTIRVIVCLESAPTAAGRRELEDAVASVLSVAIDFHLDVFLPESAK